MVTSGSWFSSHPVWLLDHPHVRRSAVHGQRTGGRGVHDASGRVVAGGGRPTLAVDLTEYADIAEIRQASEDRVVGHVRQAPVRRSRRPLTPTSPDAPPGSSSGKRSLDSPVRPVVPAGPRTAGGGGVSGTAACESPTETRAQRSSGLDGT